MYPLKFPTVMTLPFGVLIKAIAYVFKGYQSSRMIPFEDHNKLEKNYSFELSFTIFISQHLKLYYNHLYMDI